MSDMVMHIAPLQPVGYVAWRWEPRELPPPGRYDDLDPPSAGDREPRRPSPVAPAAAVTA